MQTYETACVNCKGKFNNTTYSFCPYCGKMIEKRVSQYDTLPEQYKSTFGVWNVTTEGDCEGKSIKNLGQYEGHIDEIALYLADKCYYSLCFRPTQKPETITLNPTRESTNIMLDISSKTWDVKDDVLLLTMKDLFKDRPVEINHCNYFASFSIKKKQTTN
jgi:DNA-directed RNA polymerase subunit RPC12/RpoP